MAIYLIIQCMEFIVSSEDEPTVFTYINKYLVNLYFNKMELKS